MTDSEQADTAAQTAQHGVIYGAIPCWNQLYDPLPDGGEDPQAAHDCGYENIAMVVWALRDRAAFSEGAIRQAMRQPSGETTPQQLVNTAHVWRIQAVIPGSGGPFTNVRLCIDRGFAVSMLGNWDGLGPHWVLCIGYNGPYVLVCNNPNGGRRVTVTASQFATEYLGALVVYQEALGHNLRTL
jgi:hypothetical protein